MEKTNLSSIWNTSIYTKSSKTQTPLVSQTFIIYWYFSSLHHYTIGTTFFNKQEMTVRNKGFIEKLFLKAK